jgi:hypothetical protein
MKDIIVKRLTGTASDLIPFMPDEALNDQSALVECLKGCYVRFTPLTETVMIGHKDYLSFAENECTEAKMRSSVVIVPKPLALTSQYDPPYNTVCNQCSWVSKAFVDRKQEFLSILRGVGDRDAFSRLYNDCMATGTANREAFGKLVEGENIDQIGLETPILSTTYGNDAILESLPESVKNMIVKPLIPQLPYETFCDAMKNLEDDTMVILNRDGQSFVVAKVQRMYYILDSHQRHLQVNDFHHLLNFIIEYQPDGFFYILWSIC